jgi:glutaredoxin-related protein
MTNQAKEKAMEICGFCGRGIFIEREEYFVRRNPRDFEHAVLWGVLCKDCIDSALNYLESEEFNYECSEEEMAILKRSLSERKLRKIEKEIVLQEQAKEILGAIDVVIKHRNDEQKNNNIYRQSEDELNDEFIKNLEDLRDSIREKYGVKEEEGK